MGKSEKKLVVMALAVIAGWVVLYLMLVQPLWVSHKNALSSAEQKLAALKKLTSPSKDGSESWEVPAANASLDAEATALQQMLGELQTVQATDLGFFDRLSINSELPGSWLQPMLS